MHGVSRKAPTQEEKEASSLKAAKLGELQSQLLHFHRNKIYTKEAIDISKNLLESNPEHYTGWNYRKLVVQQLLESAPDSDSVQSIVDDELRLVENALKRNFKSYGAWHHRKWILSKGHSSTDMEMRLLGKFQKLDARNFHAWNYRRFITTLKKIPDEEELQYTMDMIYDNFSNYSAWHNRSMLLSRLLEAEGKESFNKENILGEEFEFVRNALFTDPDDQSGWFYHLWLLDQTSKREPQLLYLWPPLGCNLCLTTVEGFSDGLSSLPTLTFQSKDRKFPIILYFSEAVEGVSSSTVTIECEYLFGGDYIWRPLSANKSGSAQAWLTYLNFPDEESSFKTYTVMVIVGQFPGITSSSGLSCSSPSVSFTVSGPSHDQKHSKTSTSERISPDVMFHPNAAQSEDAKVLDLLSKLKITKEKEPTASEWSIKTISNEIAHCQELLSTTNCKIGKLTLARLLMARNTLVSCGRPNDSTAFQYDEILALYCDLKKMDPSHSCYYEDEYSLALWKQVTSSVESLLKYCSEYQESSSTIMKPCLCLRLTGLSLSRFGSMDGLLWVQMLDLSHNQLRSIEGLEALQLLSYLNLRNNKISSFLALEPIRMLKSLEVLDISYNEIGAHSVDTRRYLCSSPLTNTVGNDWDFSKFTNGDINAQVHWDAFLIFKELKLTQLEIMGNAVVDNHLKVLLMKLMPTLKWLDGDSCN